MTDDALAPTSWDQPVVDLNTQVSDRSEVPIRTRVEAEAAARHYLPAPPRKFADYYTQPGCAGGTWLTSDPCGRLCDLDGAGLRPAHMAATSPPNPG